MVPSTPVITVYLTEVSTQAEALHSEASPDLNEGRSIKSGGTLLPSPQQSSISDNAPETKAAKSPPQHLPSFHFDRFALQKILSIAQVEANTVWTVIHRLQDELMALPQDWILQNEYEARLFRILSEHSPLTNLSAFQSVYRSLSRFYAARGAIVLFVTGMPCFFGVPPTLQLAERLHVTNVIRTATIISTLAYPNRHRSRLSRASEGSPSQMVEDFDLLCKLVRKGAQGDLDKAVKSGKSLILEGPHIDLRLFEDFLTETGKAADGGRSKSPVVVIPFMLTSSDCERVCQAIDYEDEAPLCCWNKVCLLQRYCSKANLASVQGVVQLEVPLKDGPWSRVELETCTAEDFNFEDVFDEMQSIVLERICIAAASGAF